MRNELEPSFDSFAFTFDIDAAFQEATTGILNDEVMHLEEKIQRVESLLMDASSEAYQSFVDFRSLASQIEMFCSHDHLFNEIASQNPTISGFIDSSRDHHDHTHNHSSSKNEHDSKSKSKISKKKKKPKKQAKNNVKRQRSWFGFYY